MRIAALLPLLVAARLAAAPSPVDPAELAGRTIVAVEVVGPATPLDPELVEDLVRTKVGEPLRPADVADTIRGLAAAGEWDLLEARATADGEGVSLVYELRPRPRIAKIEFRGTRRKEASAARIHLGYVVGEIFHPEVATEGAGRIRQALLDQGWSEPIVTATTEPDTGKDVRVMIDAESGPRLRIRRIEVRGAPPEAPESSLETASGLERDEPLDSPAREKAVTKCREELIHQGFFEAKVSLETSEPRADGAVDVVLAVSPGPRWTIERDGVDEKRYASRKVEALLAAESADDFLWNRIAASIRTAFQEEGFPDPHVRVRADRSRPGGPRLLLDAEPGERRRISEVVFEGRTAVPEKELLAVMETVPVSFFGGGGTFVDAAIRRDLDALRAVYASHGYVDAKVGALRQEPQGSGRYRLVLPIEEGALCRVESVSIEGISATEAAEVMPKLALHAGVPFDPARVVDDLFRLRSAWGNRGHLAIRVEELPQVFSADRTSVRLSWKVTPGPRTVVDRILIRGNTYTRPEVIRRAVKIAPGDPISIQGIVDAQQALARTGLFSRADVQVGGTEGRSRRDLLVTVEEGKTISLTYGAGLEYDPNRDTNKLEPRGSFSIYDNNLFGTARVLGFEARVSTIGYHFLGIFKEPNLWNAGIPGALSVFRSEDERSSIGTTITRRGSFVDTTYRLSDISRAQVRYEYQIVRPDCDPAKADCESVLGTLDKQDQENAISAISTVLLSERRDDPFDPHKGTLFSIEAKWAFKLFDANAEFWKLYGQAAGYYSYGPVTFAGSLRAGVMEPLRPVTNPDGLPALEIPIVERFFAGGRTTHRAFELDYLGIEGQTLSTDEAGKVTPIGGDALALASAEVRFPIYGNLGGVLFWDAGNVWSELSRVRLADVRNGIGAGLRFKTPVGPVRFDMGWKLGRKPGESVYEYTLSIGYPY